MHVRDKGMKITRDNNRITLNNGKVIYIYTMFFDTRLVMNS